MKKFKTLILLASSGMLLVSCGDNVSPTPVVPEISDGHTDFEPGIKIKNLVSDTSDSSKIGAMLYAYDSNASLSFNGNYKGVFKASLKAVSNSFGSKDLKDYSLLFKDKKNEKQFSVVVTNYANYAYVSVEFQGERAGINYYESEWSIGKTYGFSGIANNEKAYTKVDVDSPVDVLFDPVSMVVKTKFSDGNYYNVWDFKNEYNDNRRLKTNLTSFDEYSVSIVLNEINTSGCGNLMVYSFGNLDLSKDTISSTNPIIASNITAKAIVKKEYEIPGPKILSLNGAEYDSKDISIRVFDSQGSELELASNKFTPSEEGEYYLYYSYLKNEISASASACVKAIKESTKEISFSEIDMPTVVGQGKRIELPRPTITTNLGIDSDTYSCSLEVKKDGQLYKKYSEIDKGTEFEFADKGTFEFTFYNDNFEEFIKKTVVANEAMAINENDISLKVGDEFVAPAIEFFKNGRTVSYKTTVFSPNGEEFNGDVLEDEGIYKVQYKLASEIKPYEKSIKVYKKNATLFDEGLPEHGSMTTANSISGVKLSLKNNEEVTYKNKINLNNFKYDASLENPADNKEIVKLYIQPKTQGVNDIDALYVKLTDVNNADNYLTIRLKYLSYFGSGTFIRARASNQSTFVGYNYAFGSTALDVHNAVSHEEGGFTSYLNFTSICNGERYENMGFPLYFNNDTNRFYSRPAWLTGHNQDGHTDYNDKKVPWLVYDFSTDDGRLSGGNTPWKGFSSNEVYLSVYGKGISSTADIFITSIDGMDLTNDYIEDTDNPIVEVNKTEFVQDSITKELVTPNAELNKPYTLFDFDSKDATSYVVSKEAKVTSPTGENVTITDNKFIPTVEGTYEINYFARDSFGNVGNEVVKVKASNKTNTITMNLDGVVPSSLRYGDNAVLPTPLIEGGSGNVKVNVSLTGSDGNKISLSHMRFVALNKSSIYNVKYEAKDYIGNTAVIEKQISVTRTDDVIFDPSTISLPVSFVNYDNYVFDNYSGIMYDSSYNETKVPAKIQVVDSKGERNIKAGEAYTPICSQENKVAVVRFIFGGKTNYVIERNVNIVDPQINTSNYIASYFTSMNADVTSSSDGVNFASNGSNAMSFAFPRAIDAQNLLIDFGLDLYNFEFTDFVVTLKDIYHNEQEVKLHYSYKYHEATALMKLFVSVNDEEDEEITNLGIEGILRINYKADDYSISDVTGAEVTTLETYSNGDEFKGFSSGNVYMDVWVGGINDGRFNLTMKKINNQVTNITRDDYQEPNITVNGEFTPRVPTGYTMTLPSASSYDVLNCIGDLTVEVTLDNKVILEKTLANEEHQITFNEIGSYVVLYQVSDANNNVQTVRYVVSVYDDVKPTLKFNGDMPTEVKTNSKVELPGYVIEDNDDISTVTVNAFVYYPDGTMKEVKNNIVNTTVAGKYVVNYIVKDINNNISYYTFTFVAK